MGTEFSRSYPIITETFDYNGASYNIALTPELYPDEDGLDFTGRFHCIVISSNRGTLIFDLSPDESTRWETEPRGIDPGLVDKLAEFIARYRKGEYH